MKADGSDSSDERSEVTHLLSAMDAGDPHAAEQLLPLVYDELRKLAAARLAHENPGLTLDATALVHEAYLRLVRTPAAVSSDFANRRHFFAAAAEAMRRILIENARRKRRHKHGGQVRRVALDDLTASIPDEQLIELDAGLTRLEAEDAVAAEVVKLRWFAGLGHEQIAQSLGITVYKARQKWAYARAWLREAMNQ